MVESISKVSDDGRIVRMLTAYMAFLQGKERAGIERAMGATGFGAGKFAPGIYRKLIGLGAMQDAFATISFSVYLARSISAPLIRLSSNMTELANNIIEIEIEGIARKDEIGSMAKAVEEQEAATQEISNSINMASDGTQTAMDNARNVAEVINETAHEASIVQSASDSLSETSEQLAAIVDVFLTEVSNDVTERRNSLRIKMQQVAIIQTSGQRLNGTILDVSQTGCQIEGVKGKIGELVHIELANSHMVEGQIARLIGDGIGVKFFKQLDDISDLIAA